MEGSVRNQKVPKAQPEPKRLRFVVAEQPSPKAEPRLWFPFDERKATAAASVFLKAHGGTMQHLRLMKLMYIADRRSIQRWNEPIAGGKYCSMKLGTVPGTVYDIVKEGGKVWSKHVRRLGANSVELIGTVQTGSLSKEEVGLLQDVSAEFEKVKTFALCELTHDFGEYEETERTSRPIAAEKLMRVLGKTNEEIEEAAADAARRLRAAQLFA